MGENEPIDMVKCCDEELGSFFHHMSHDNFWKAMALFLCPFADILNMIVFVIVLSRNNNSTLKFVVCAIQLFFYTWDCLNHLSCRRRFHISITINFLANVLGYDIVRDDQS